MFSAPLIELGIKIIIMIMNLVLVNCLPYSRLFQIILYASSCCPHKELVNVIDLWLKRDSQPGVVVPFVITVLRMLRQEDYCKFQASLGNKLNFKSTWARE